MNTLVDGVSYLITGADADADGFYHGDTRHLTPLSVAVGGVDLTDISETHQRPSSWTRRRANVGTAVNEITTSVATKHATVVTDRYQSVSEGRLRDRFSVRNHSDRDRAFDVTFEFETDFADVFEVRENRTGASREITRVAEGKTVTLSYEYEDDAGEEVTLETGVTFSARPTTLEPDAATFAPTLGPGECWQVAVDVYPGGDESTVRSVQSASEAGERDGAGGERADPFVVPDPLETGRQRYDRVFAQARRDVRALTTRTEHGLVPLAGAPWFVTVFGRDALVASQFLLPVAPALARGTLRYLAAQQGTGRDDRRDEAPGKILHEVRRGELARTAAIPHRPYYGSVDATPLWVTLLRDTWRWTGDDDLVAELRRPLDRALEHVEQTVGAVGDDPFLYYRGPGQSGVVHKVWRDDANGVQYRDGRRARPPLASAAVQGYLYDALTGAATLASAVRGDETLASELAERAEDLKAQFDDAFWMPDRETYATAVTPDGDRVDSVTSTVGHCLWSGIVPPRRVDAVVDRLLASDVYSGWGLRTLSADDDGYSPISYHAGGVWPHDNALVALGLAAYDRHDAAATVAGAQLDAIAEMDGASAPELFCGFDDAESPVRYPSACRPQLWAAAAPFGFLRALFDFAAPGSGGAEKPRQPGIVSEDALDAILAYWS